MPTPRSLIAWCLLPALLSPPALAEEPPVPPQLSGALRRIDAALVRPLAERETNRFSRGRPPPAERRVRLAPAGRLRDAAGREYLTFAIDVRFDDTWRENDVVGCLYPASGTLYVKRGDQYRPAEFLLGKPAAPAVGVCEPPKQAAA